MNFKASNGKYYTRQLFVEEFSNLPIDQRSIAAPLFSLHKDKPGLVNFGKAYVDSRDPTGYKVATQLLDSYNHWQALMTCRWFLAAKELWDKEMDAAIKSEAMQEMMLILKEGLPAQRLAAAKYLAGAEYKKDKSASKGRPKREDIDRAAKELAANERDIEDDLKRIKGTR